MNFITLVMRTNNDKQIQELWLRKIIGVGLIGLFLVGIFLKFSDTHTTHTLPLVPCPIKFTTGVDCPGCGMTRACLEVSQGNFYSAWNFHPFAFLLVGGSIIFVFFPSYWNRWHNLPQKQQNFFFIIILIAVLVRWIVHLSLP